MDQLIVAQTKVSPEKVGLRLKEQQSQHPLRAAEHNRKQIE